MHTLGEWILGNTHWLYTKIWETPVFFLDYWSFVHFWSGFVLFCLLLVFRVKQRFRWLFFIVSLYEVIEIAFIFMAFNAFRPETLKDQLTDIVVGMLGGGVAFGMVRVASLARRSQGRMRPALFHPVFRWALTAVTIAFPWVGSYQYRYNLPCLNAEGFNWYTFSLWTFGIFAILWVWEALRPRLQETWMRSLVLWGMYVLCLLAAEAIGFYGIGVRESGHPYTRPLVAGLIHGTRVLHGFYLSVPFLAILASRLFRKLFDRAVASLAVPVFQSDFRHAFPRMGLDKRPAVLEDAQT
jgi:hypothetical protein